MTRFVFGVVACLGFLVIGNPPTRAAGTVIHNVLALLKYLSAAAVITLACCLLK